MSDKQSRVLNVSALQICKLCLKNVNEVGDLCNSHIIPRFILKKSKEYGRCMCFYGESDKLIRAQTDWKERMLCEECERKLKIRYEDFLNETIFWRREKPILFETPERICFSVNNDKVVLALLSIFWRAIVSTLKEFQYVRVPDYIENDLRDWIYNGHITAGWNKLLSINLIQLNDRNGEVVYLTASPFLRDKSADGYFEFVFVCGGYCITFAIPPAQPGHALEKLSLRPQSKIVRVKKVHYSEVPELKKMISRMMKLEDGKGVQKYV